MANPNTEVLRPYQFSSTNQPAPGRNGRPKGSVSITDRLKKYLKRTIQFNDPVLGKTVNKKIADVITLRLIANAIRGDLGAIQEILDRVDGVKKHPNGVGNTNVVIAIRAGSSILTQTEAERVSPKPSEV